jgi:hypothetical protein
VLEREVQREGLVAVFIERGLQVLTGESSNCRQSLQLVLCVRIKLLTERK